MQINEHIYRSKVKTVTGWCKTCEGTLYLSEPHVCGSTNARTGQPIDTDMPEFTAARYGSVAAANAAKDASK
jgi:hypothetical protein